jgi:nicotinamidase-related amidase
MSGKVLIVIDYTNDFVADDGKLTVGEPGQNIENYILNLVQEFTDEDNRVLMAVDLHYLGDTDHREYGLFPEHNIFETSGRDLYGNLGEWYSKNYSKWNVEYMDKTFYSAFADTDLDTNLREGGVQEIHLVGVCTDICVLHTAVDAYNKGYDVVIHEKGVASFDQVGHEWSLNHFKNTLGFKVI